MNIVRSCINYVSDSYNYLTTWNYGRLLNTLGIRGQYAQFPEIRFMGNIFQWILDLLE